MHDRIDWLNGDTSGRACKYLWLLGNEHNKWSLDSSDTDNPDYLDSWSKVRYDRGEYKLLADTDKQRLIAGYNHALTLREKRCRAYLKRYGLSKIHISTYWMDR